MIRRRFLALTAAAAGVALLPGGAGFAGDPLEWKGTALGADALLRFYHDDRTAGRRLLAEVLAEIERLERVFSLYRDDSALVALNRTGRLDAPPLELVELLSISSRFSELTGGAFDVTVQPLWQLYAGHFARDGADPAGPPIEAVARTRRLVDWRGVTVEAGRVALARPGMAITLNGIAQGFVTDRIAALMRRRGMAHVLVDMGEIAAIGGRPGGQPWRVGVAGGGVTPLVDAAIATSSPDGTRFSPTCHHIFDPHTGLCAEAGVAAVSVWAPQATVADAVSTALVVGGTRWGEGLARAAGVSIRGLTVS
jgi:FAD:protein FMN transferase